MGSAEIKTTNAKTSPLDQDDEFVASIVRGIEDYKEGRVTICHNKDEALKDLDSL